MYKKWISLMLATILLLALMAGCRKPVLPGKAEDPSKETQETLENIPGVGENDFTDEDFVDSLTGATDTTPETSEPTDSTQPSTEATQPVTDPTESTGATEYTESTESTESTQPSEGNKITVYEWYESLSPEEQVAYFETFESMEAFVKWHNEAKAEYDKLHPPINSGDGNIDFGDIAGN